MNIRNIFSTKDDVTGVDQFMRALLLALFVFVVCFGCTKFNGYFGLEEDHFAEELAESIIESKLGLPSGSIDLTPDSPE